VFLSCRPFDVNTTFSTGLEVLLTANCPSQETEETSRLVENVVLTKKGLNKRNAQVLDGTTVKNR
jgi:hypothetical protein